MSDDRASSSLIPLGTRVVFAKTITVACEVAEEDVASGKTVATVTATNQDGEVVAAASHILKFL